eukprot:318562-Chlamydomonas_euryale.AAC.1
MEERHWPLLALLVLRLLSRKRVPGLLACFAGDEGRAKLRAQLRALGGRSLDVAGMMELEDTVLAHGSGDYY